LRDFFLKPWVAEWGSQSKFPKFQKMLVENATEGFIALALIAGGLVLALVFEKKFGWLLSIVGVLFLLKILGVL